LLNTLRRNHLDDLLLQLIVIDTLAVADPRRTAAAELMLDRCIPRRYRHRVLERYDALTEGWRDDCDVPALWLPRAAARDSRWKTRMIACMIQIVTLDGAVSAAGLAEVAALARMMGAEQECRCVFGAALPGYFAV
jgi:hypothetical protein